MLRVQSTGRKISIKKHVVSTETKNHCTYWSVGEMRKLAQLIDTGIPISSVADKLGRTPNACRDRLTRIRVAYLLNVGTDDQTAKDFRKITDLHEQI